MEPKSKKPPLTQWKEMHELSIIKVNYTKHETLRISSMPWISVSIVFFSTLKFKKDNAVNNCIIDP